MEGLTLMEENEYKEAILELFSKAVEYTVISQKGFFAIVVDKEELQFDQDGGLSWHARVAAIGQHAFITIETGEKKTKEIVIPLCLCTEKGRAVVNAFLSALQDNKHVKIYLGYAEGSIRRGPTVLGAELTFDVSPITMLYVTTQLMPQELLNEWKEPVDCPYCQMEGKP